MPLTDLAPARRLAAAAMRALLLAAPAGAAQAACQVAVDPVAFGTIDPTRESTGTGRVVVTCDAATATSVALSAPGGGRTLAGPGGAAIFYELYQDVARTTRWGDGGFRPARGASVGSTEPSRLTIYGVIPSQTGVVPGGYLDHLQVTLTF
jgi:spore coat protein U-like protein